LFKVGELEKEKGVKILENNNDKRIIQKLVDYLSTLEYWHDPDSGMWEENEEVHASSIGACIAGLEMVKDIDGIEVSEDLIKKGYEALAKLLPRESDGKFVDLALLSLIWPYEVTTKRQTKEILKNVEYHLLKNRGVIRYKGDHYYNKNLDNISEEAEWTFGLSWLTIIYEMIGKKKKARKFLEKNLGTVTKEGEVPELYYSNTDKPNDNTPLGWSESLFITSLYYINHAHTKRKTTKNTTKKKTVKKKIAKKKVAKKKK
jgi:GH15 family glucan-1,4-alpha-glucosidase